MRKSVRALGIAVALIGGLLFAAAPALAGGPHIFSMSFGSAGSGAGQLSFSGYGGVAVNAATHDVYVADTGNNRVDQFSATGAFVRAWGWGVADGLPAFETCTLTCQAGIQGSGAGQLSSPTFIAVDNSGGVSAGDVYVGDANNRVSKFSAEGAYISSNDGSGANAPIAGPFGALAGIAVDSSGDLWVYGQSASMFEFAQDGSFVTDWNSGRGVTPYGIDVDAAGNLYVLTGGGSIEQFTAAGTDVGPVNGDASDPSGFAVDHSSGDVYMDSGKSLIRHYEASCDAGGRCTAADTFGSGVLLESWGLGVDSSTDAVYVADGHADTISLFVPPTPAPPEIDGTMSAIEVTGSSAVLRAVINPHLLSTTYHFEYGTSSGYGQSTPESASIGSDYAEHTVSAHIQGLAPSTIYHFRVVATNSAAPGGVPGPDQTITTQPVGNGGGADTCPNAAIRVQQHAAALPDCRAYEQVSPPGKGGNSILGYGVTGGSFWQASADGNAVIYSSAGAFADAQAGGATSFPYLASRVQSGWSTHSLLPPQATGHVGPEPKLTRYTEDLSKGLLSDGGSGFFSDGQDQPPLVPGEPAENQNVFLRDNLTNSYQLVDVTPPGVTASAAKIEGASADLSHVFFSENAQLTTDSPPPGEQPHLFEWSGGIVRLAGILPGGTAVPASQLLDVRSVSEDGSRVFFSDLAARAPQTIYLRQDATSTVQVDASHGPGPGGGGQFQAASSDGSLAYFTDDAARGLTNDTVSGSGANLYRYDANSGTLTDLTPAAKAEVLGVVGASTGGSYVYFVANGVLAPGASAGDCTPSEGTSRETETQTCSLYLYRGGVTTFIATLNGEDVSKGFTFGMNATVSPDGGYLAFLSLSSLTGYDNLAASGVQCGNALRIEGGPQPRCSEVFLYDAAAGPSGKLSCASCNPSGGAPIGNAKIAPMLDSEVSTSDSIGYQPRYLFDSGRLFFNSGDALVPQDVNGQQDVYEFEPFGVGSCGLAQGCVSLISSGRGPDASTLLDASATGNDVFFATSDPLVAQDGDQIRDLYDARVDGGIASQNDVAAPPCSGESCKAPASGQSGVQTPSSTGFSGPGNLTPPGVQSSHGKPVKKRHVVKRKRHQKKKKSRRARGRRANHNHGGAK
jgi:hypothetical protein